MLDCKVDRRTAETWTHWVEIVWNFFFAAVPFHPSAPVCASGTNSNVWNSFYTLDIHNSWCRCEFSCDRHSDQTHRTFFRKFCICMDLEGRFYEQIYCSGGPSFMLWLLVVYASIRHHKLTLDWSSAIECNHYAPSDPKKTVNTIKLTFSCMRSIVNNKIAGMLKTFSAGGALESS